MYGNNTEESNWSELLNYKGVGLLQPVHLVVMHRFMNLRELPLNKSHHQSNVLAEPRMEPTNINSEEVIVMQEDGKEVWQQECHVQDEGHSSLPKTRVGVCAVV